MFKKIKAKWNELSFASKHEVKMSAAQTALYFGTGAAFFGALIIDLGLTGGMASLLIGSLYTVVGGIFVNEKAKKLSRVKKELGRGHELVEWKNNAGQKILSTRADRNTLKALENDQEYPVSITIRDHEYIPVRTHRKEMPEKTFNNICQAAFAAASRKTTTVLEDPKKGQNSYRFNPPLAAAPSEPAR